MGKIILVTGGARSGKSTFSEKQVKLLNQSTAYIATAVAFDSGMQNRINKHIAQRPSHWQTFEKSTKIHEIIDEIAKEHQVILLDCITVLVTNTLLNHPVDWDHIKENEIDKIEQEIQNDLVQLVESLKKHDMTVYLVTNEVGSGIVPENRLARIFRDIAGRSNQYLASEANEVYYVVSGMPLKIKAEL